MCYTHTHTRNPAFVAFNQKIIVIITKSFQIYLSSIARVPMKLKWIGSDLAYDSIDSYRVINAYQIELPGSRRICLDGRSFQVFFVQYYL